MGSIVEWRWQKIKSVNSRTERYNWYNLNIEIKQTEKKWTELQGPGDNNKRLIIQIEIAGVQEGEERVGLEKHLKECYWKPGIQRNGEQKSGKKFFK